MVVGRNLHTLQIKGYHFGSFGWKITKFLDFSQNKPRKVDKKYFCQKKLRGALHGQFSAVFWPICKVLKMAFWALVIKYFKLEKALGNKKPLLWYYLSQVWSQNWSSKSPSPSRGQQPIFDVFGHFRIPNLAESKRCCRTLQTAAVQT